MILFNRGHKIDEGNSISFSAEVGREEDVDLTLFVRGSGDATLNLDIKGTGARVRIRGLYLCDGSDQVNVNVNVTHSVGYSFSEQIFRGVVDGNAKVRFNGRILVAHDAQKTEAFQTSRSLLLSDTADVQTSPQLEIYADDVKCSHGATIGALNEDEQFYMRSRGISLQEAKRLQIISFLSVVSEGLPEGTFEL